LFGLQWITAQPSILLAEEWLLREAWSGRL